MNKVKKYFITGLITIIPVFLTVYFLVFVFQFIDGILGKYLNLYLKDKLGLYIPGMGFILSILIIFLVGFLATWLIFQKLISKIEKGFLGLPLIKNIYPTFKQLVMFLLNQKEVGFQKVVLVQYPSHGIWSIGFLTSDQVQKINQALDGREMVAVFMPTTPGPFSGYVIFVPKEEVRFPDISVKNALKILISGGVFEA